MRYHTLNNITVKQVHELGKKEVDRILIKLKSYFKKYNVKSLKSLYRKAEKKLRMQKKKYIELIRLSYLILCHNISKK